MGTLVVEAPPEAEEADDVLIRTVVQIDGDVLVMLHPEVLTRPDFPELLSAHQHRVREAMIEARQRLARLPRFAELLRRVAPVLGVAQWVLWPEQLPGDWVHHLLLAGGFAWGVLGRRLGGWVLRWWIRRQIERATGREGAQHPERGARPQV